MHTWIPLFHPIANTHSTYFRPKLWQITEKKLICMAGTVFPHKHFHPSPPFPKQNDTCERPTHLHNFAVQFVVRSTFGTGNYLDTWVEQLGLRSQAGDNQSKNTKLSVYFGPGS